MKNQMQYIKSFPPFLIFTFFATCIMVSCKESRTDSGLIPLSLITLAKEAEDQEKLNQCMGILPPGYVCTADLTPYPTSILQAELRNGSELISSVNTSDLPYHSGGCVKYYKITWNDGSDYKISTLFFWNGKLKGVCAISMAKTNGEVKSYLLDISEEDGVIEKISEINSNGLTLKFYR
ncbi:hypothetical protein EHQ46_17145 [Leptospira yanagawae]|uniref:Lipoprotein n=1 Tax=Leptospira yanagawae TaxID=293069 RepID=A0ABY2LYU0_9LEPT|nr:hypothetical protein [Leptospira yanagawae]TGL17181.1 hypothetical protein EHQ46_17145 [Leptospira yanagawae]